MNFGEFSVKNKYLILVIMIGIVIFGLYGRATMNTQLAPDTNPPMATVMSTYPGASAVDVATDISEPMEKVLAKLEGVTDVQSTSQDNISIIQLTFDYTTNIDQAAIDIQNTLSQIRETLPSSMDEPKVLKFSASDKPIMTIGINSHSLSMPSLRRLAEEKLVYDLQLVDGVASVDLIGGYQREISVRLDADKIRAKNLTLEQVARTLETYNIKAPTGKIIHNGKDLLLRVESSVVSVEALRQMNISLADSNVVRLGDIAEVSQGGENRESAYRLNGEEALALLITKKSGYNTVDVINSISEKLEDMKVDYPFVEIMVASDDSQFTKQMVNNMTSSVIIAILFTVVVILLFITNVSRSLVVSISMPLVFLSTLGLMRAFNMDLDLVTLSALILSIGFVVDAAIVIVENISRHHGMSKNITKAAIDGTGEIAYPTIAGATTTLIVLVPLLFIEGFVGEMFRPLSMTLIFAISSSIVVALLMIPLLSVLLEPLKLNKLEEKIMKVAGPFNNIMGRLLEWYLKLSKKVLRYKLRTLVVIFVLLAASGLFLKSNGMEMLPKFDSGVTYVTVEMEPGTTLEETSTALTWVEDYLANEPEVVNFDTRIGYEQGNSQMGDFGMMGTDQGMITVTLSSRKERTESIWDFQERLRDFIDDLPDVNRFVVKEQGGTAVSSASAPIELKISGEDLDVLYFLADKFEQKIADVEGTTNIYKSYNDGYQQMSIKLNDRRLKELGLTSKDVSQQLYGAMEGLNVSTMTLDTSEILDIRVHYDNTNAQLEEMFAVDLMTPLGVKVPLREVASVEISPRSNHVERDNLEYSVKILGFTKDRAFSHVINDIGEMVDEIPLPKGYSVEFTGEQKTLTDSMGDMAFLLSLAIIFVYLLLVPQFKSFVQPLTIMIAIPLVVVGVAPALGLTGKYMSMPVLLGFILLAGTVVNNAILLVHAMNKSRENGATLEEATEEAIKTRYWPIMMTALSDAVGMLPLALQLALGSERFSPLAITVIGGILAATFLTLVTIPLIYVSFEIVKLKLHNHKNIQRNGHDLTT